MSCIHTPDMAPANEHMVGQMALAQGVVAALVAKGIVVDRLEIGPGRPVVHVTMPVHAPCLPGTTIVRRRHAFGVETEQRAELGGCLVHWRVA